MCKSDFGSFAIMVYIFSQGRMPILAVYRLHLIDPSSIEHNSACFNYTNYNLLNMNCNSFNKTCSLVAEIQKFNNLNLKTLISNM